MSSYHGGEALPQVGLDTRAQFLVRTYNHLFGAIISFVILEWILFASGVAQRIASAMLGVSWLIILGAFMIVSWFASRIAHRSLSLQAQYLALGGFVVAQALLFIPLLYIANTYAPGAIESAGVLTLLGFAGLTGIAFWTRKDFSFLGGFLRWGLLLALVAIVGAVLFGFHLGTWFSVAMVGVAGAAILYDTSKILRDFPTDRHVAAALELFSSVALMLWYVLRLTSRD